MSKAFQTVFISLFFIGLRAATFTSNGIATNIQRIHNDAGTAIGYIIDISNGII